MQVGVFIRYIHSTWITIIMATMDTTFLILFCMFASPPRWIDSNGKIFKPCIKMMETTTMMMMMRKSKKKMHTTTQFNSFSSMQCAHYKLCACIKVSHCESNNTYSNRAYEQSSHDTIQRGFLFVTKAFSISSHNWMHQAFDWSSDLINRSFGFSNSQYLDIAYIDWRWALQFHCSCRCFLFWCVFVFVHSACVCRSMQPKIQYDFRCWNELFFFLSFNIA